MGCLLGHAYDSDDDGKKQNAMQVQPSKGHEIMHNLIPPCPMVHYRHGQLRLGRCASGFVRKSKFDIRLPITWKARAVTPRICEFTRATPATPPLEVLRRERRPRIITMKQL